jgi:hypothetical protein
MPSPLITGSPIILKSSGDSYFWLKATNVAAGNAVVLSSSTLTGFTGQVIKALPGNNQYWLIKVTPDLALKPKKKMKLVEAEEIGSMTITITNAGGQSGTLIDEVIIDDMPGARPGTKKAVSKPVGKSAKATSKTAYTKAPKKKANAKKKSSAKSTVAKKKPSKKK